MGLPERRGERELAALLELRSLPGIGEVSLRALLARHGTAEAALDAPAAELGEQAAAERGSPRVRGRVARSLEVLRRIDAVVIREGDAAYPASLLELHDPPVVLFALGRLDLLERTAVAVVGSRHPTTYGLEATHALARDLARAGIVVVSGMARGIDAAAHEAALEGGTIGVLGCGLDVVYPHEQARLYRAVEANGLLLSEFAPGEPALRHHFPRRNRIIAALARGVLVVEASERSGALITVDHALDLGREVFAVPGPIGRATSAGTNAMIQQGAKLVTCGADILEELGLAAPAEAEGEPRPPVDVSPAALQVWRALGPEPRHADELGAVCGFAPAVVLACALELELAGHARQLPGKLFVRG